jgi:hypothetical protein
MADDNSPADGPSSTDTDEDDPWADVAGEDELRDRALSESSYGDAESADGDDSDDGTGTGLDAYAGDDADTGGSDSLQDRAGAVVAAAEAAVEACDAKHAEADILVTIANNVEDRIDAVPGMEPDERASFANALDRLDEKTERVREETGQTHDVEDDHGDDREEANEADDVAGDDDGAPDDPGTFDPPTEADQEQDDAEAATDGGDAAAVEPPEEPQPEPEPEPVPAFEDGDGVEVIPEDVSCADCKHRQVCVILSSFSPQLDDEAWDAGLEDEGSPIDPMDLAKVCDAYDPEEGEAATQEATTDG